MKEKGFDKMSNCFVMNGSYVRLVSLGVLYAIFVCLGAVLFSHLEKPEEQRLVQRIHGKKAQFLENNTCIDKAELNAFINELREAWNFGVLTHVSGTQEELISSWDFGSSFFFTTTLLTTTGFGAVTPLTHGGKVACITYSLIGIPLTFLFLGTVTYVASKPVRKILDKMLERWGSYIPELSIRLIHLILLIIFAAIFFFLVPAIVFSVLEPNWTLLDSLYFIFIALTTVGLGDFVPGYDVHAPYLSQRALYQILTAVYLLVGICMMLIVVEFCILIPTVGQIWDVVSPIHSRRGSNGGHILSEKDNLKDSLQQLTEYNSINDDGQ